MDFLKSCFQHGLFEFMYPRLILKLIGSLCYSLACKELLYTLVLTLLQCINYPNSTILGCVCAMLEAVLATGAGSQNAVSGGTGEGVGDPSPTPPPPSPLASSSRLLWYWPLCQWWKKQTYNTQTYTIQKWRCRCGTMYSCEVWCIKF